MTEKEKMTAPISSVGADVEQSSSNKLTNQSIARKGFQLLLIYIKKLLMK